MQFTITKLFRTDSIGNLIEADVVLHREGGQMRKITGKIGGHSYEGSYVVNILGKADTVNVEVSEGVTLHIEPYSK